MSTHVRSSIKQLSTPSSHLQEDIQRAFQELQTGKYDLLALKVTQDFHIIPTDPSNL